MIRTAIWSLSSPLHPWPNLVLGEGLAHGVTWNRIRNRWGGNTIKSKKLVVGRPCTREDGWGGMRQEERQLAGRQSFIPRAWMFGAGNQTASCPEQYGSAYLSCSDLGTVEFNLLIRSYFSAFLVSRQCSTKNFSVFICVEPSAQIFACVL